MSKAGDFVAVEVWGRWHKVMLPRLGLQSNTQTPWNSLKNARKATQAKWAFPKARDTNTESFSWHWHCSWGLAHVRISAQKFREQQSSRNSEHVTSWPLWIFRRNTRNENADFLNQLSIFLVTEMPRGLQNITQVLWQSEGEKVFGEMGNGEVGLAG